MTEYVEISLDELAEWGLDVSTDEDGINHIVPLDDAWSEDDQ